MSKLLNKPIIVFTEKDFTPRKVHYQNKLLVIDQILDRWQDVGKWWEGESVKEFWRVQIQGDANA